MTTLKPVIQYYNWACQIDLGLMSTGTMVDLSKSKIPMLESVEFQRRQFYLVVVPGLLIPLYEDPCNPEPPLQPYSKPLS